MTLTLSPNSRKRAIDREFSHHGFQSMIRYGQVYITQKMSRIRTDGNIASIQQSNDVCTTHGPDEDILNARWQIARRDMDKQQQEFTEALLSNRKRTEYQANQASEELRELWLDMNKTRFSYLR